MNKEKLRNFQCPMEACMGIIGGKYKCIIVWHLIGNTLRYSELQRLVNNITPKMLTQQLKELEADGIIHRKVYPVVPPKTEYSLSEIGKTLAPIIRDLDSWGAKYYEFQGVENPRKDWEEIHNSKNFNI